MSATRYDIKVEQGANFEFNIQAKNGTAVADLSGYSARMQIRESVATSTTLLDANTSNGYITINGPGGIVMINVPASITTAMTWNTGVYDIEVYTSATNVKRLAEGSASLSLEVTR